MHITGQNPQRPAVKAGVPLPLPDIDRIGERIGSDDEKRFGPSAHSEPLALADGVVVRTVVFAHLHAVGRSITVRKRHLLKSRPGGSLRITGPVGGYLHDVALPRSEFLLQEEGQVHLPDEAYSLRILAFGSGELLLGCDAAHLGFQHVADGKHGPRKLRLRELTQKIALVLVGVGTRQRKYRAFRIL